MTLVQIAVTWPVFQKLKPDVQALVSSRLAECDICPFKRQYSPQGYQVVGDNKLDSVYYCGACGCPLWNKTKEEENKCPKDHWKPVESFY